MAVLQVRAKGEGLAWALVDNADLDRLGKYRWLLDRDGYAYRMETIDEYRGRPRRKIRLHRDLLGLEHGDAREGDHINGQRLDNRRENLRAVGRGKNQQNVHKRHGRNRYRNVTWAAANGKWKVEVTVAGKQHFLGYFEDEEEANDVATRFREEHHV